MKQPTTALFAIFAITIGFLSSSCTKTGEMESTRKNAATAEASHVDPDGYFTCSMHPQVHEHKPGACPICGMALVKVMPKESTQNSAQLVSASDTQLMLAGINKHKVERKDLTFSVPVSGRFLSSREIVFQVYESDLSVVKPGMKFMGVPAAAPSEKLDGQIRYVDKLLDPASRTARVTGVLNKAFPNASIEGLFSGEISAKLEHQIAIPDDAVLHTGERDLVYVVSPDNTLKPVAVSLGKKAGGEYQLISGLNEGEVISRGSNFLIDSEAKIRGTSDATPTSSGKPETPKCPPGERWDLSMSMCMPSGENQ